MSDRPSSWESWPSEVQALWTASLRAEATDDAEGVRVALDYLSTLMQTDDHEVGLAAATALLELSIRYAPELKAQLRERILRETRDGQSLVEVALQLLKNASNDEERRAAEKLLEMTTALPARGRA